MAYRRLRDKLHHVRCAVCAYLTSTKVRKIHSILHPLQVQTQPQRGIKTFTTNTMKVLFTLAVIVQHIFVVIAFTATTTAKGGATSNRNQNILYNQQKGGSSAELGLPCVDECALESFPNLPPSVHPGVLSGQAQIDLLNHAKENGNVVLIVSSIFVHIVAA